MAGGVEKPPVLGREQQPAPQTGGLAGTLSCVVHISCNPPEIKESQRVYFLRSLKQKAWCQLFLLPPPLPSPSCLDLVLQSPVLRSEQRAPLALFSSGLQHSLPWRGVCAPGSQVPSGSLRFPRQVLTQFSVWNLLADQPQPPSSLLYLAQWQ